MKQAEELIDKFRVEFARIERESRMMGLSHLLGTLVAYCERRLDELAAWNRNNPGFLRVIASAREATERMRRS